MGNTTRKTETKSLNRSLHTAKAAKQDEFYTQYVDIQKEVEAYLEFDPDTFRGKVVYCNCDDPFESNFFKYFAANFNKLGLKKLITNSYDGSPIAGQGTLFPEYNEGNGKRRKPKALAVILDRVKDEDGDGAANVTDVELFLKRNKAARKALQGDDNYPGGDFRSPECVALLKEADMRTSKATRKNGQTILSTHQGQIISLTGRSSRRISTRDSLSLNLLILRGLRPALENKLLAVGALFVASGSRAECPRRAMARLKLTVDVPLSTHGRGAGRRK
jgi:hypothetical protein